MRVFRFLAILILLPYPLTILYIVVPPPSTLMLADLVMLHMPHRTWVPLKRISPALIESVIVSEDSAFCSHYGFDWTQIGNNLDRAMDGKRYGGASTITQQTAKNLFLWKGRSWLRKFLEAPITLWMELVMSKKRIMEIYLNTAQWDRHVYGTEAAAQHHFGVDAANLSIGRSSLLAVSLPNPVRRNAGKPSANMIMSATRIAIRVTNHNADMSCLH